MPEDQCEHPPPDTRRQRVGQGQFQTAFESAELRPSSTLWGSRQEKKMSMTTRALSLCLLILSMTALLYSQGGAYGTTLGNVTDYPHPVLPILIAELIKSAQNVATHVQT